jgi:hypothetical protein
MAAFVVMRKTYLRFFLWSAQNLLLPSVNRLHLLPSFVMAAQRIFFFATAFFVFFFATFFALRIKCPPSFSLDTTKSLIVKTMSRKKINKPLKCSLLMTRRNRSPDVQQIKGGGSCQSSNAFDFTKAAAFSSWSKWMRSCWLLCRNVPRHPPCYDRSVEA